MGLTQFGNPVVLMLKSMAPTHIMAVMIVVKKTIDLSRSGCEPCSRRKGPHPLWPATTEAAATSVMKTPERNASSGLPVGSVESKAPVGLHPIRPLGLATRRAEGRWRGVHNALVRVAEFALRGRHGDGSVHRAHAGAKHALRQVRRGT